MANQTKTATQPSGCFCCKRLLLSRHSTVICDFYRQSFSSVGEGLAPAVLKRAPFTQSAFGVVARIRDRPCRAKRDRTSRPKKHKIQTYRWRLVIGPVAKEQIHKQSPPPIGEGLVYGADNRIRTDDLVITNDVLYRLSYSSVVLTTVIL